LGKLVSSTSLAPRNVEPGSITAWILAARPATLSAAVVPVAIGSACAFHAGGFRADAAMVALAGALLFQIAANFSNDLSDFARGADTEERLGPTRAVQAGLLEPGSVRRGLFLVIALSIPCGLYLWSVAGPWVIAIGVLSILSAVAYTAGPYPLGYHGLGDVFVMTFFGFVGVCGSAWVQAGSVPPLAWPAGLAAGSTATAILVVNNLRDRNTDERANKRTLAVRLGRRGTIVEYVLLVVTAYAVPIVLWGTGELGPAVWLPVLSLPLAVYRVARVARDEGRALNRSLVGTAQLMLVHGLLLALGIVLDSVAA
jgi:1,4-dihydroxy-2-naphthoate octaprenyltransferase